MVERGWTKRAVVTRDKRVGPRWR